MRAGANCAAQQTLSAEAASALKHSLSLARRRGHAQVTPLHVAATLLTSRASSLLRSACLKSQPHNQPSHHPLQCRALELCFNVALNRLPASPSPLLHAHQPSLSNALVAALKRAQAHQRRGCIEQNQQQQQPLIAIKVELEQLILSILDDPSVSRVMREAGFSSTAVKSNIEDSNNTVSSVFQCYNTTSGGIYSTPNSPPNESTHHHSTMINASSGFWQSHLLSYTAASSDAKNPTFLFSSQKKMHASNPISGGGGCSFEDDVKRVLDVLVTTKKRRNNIVIVGDSMSTAEGLVAELMGKVEMGDVPEQLKSVRFVKFQFSTVPLRFMKREEVEMNVGDLKRKVDSFASDGGGVIIYTGDLKWTVDDDGDDERDEEGRVYSPVDHLVAEMGKLVSLYNNNSSNTERVWLMATANYQTYMKCQMKQPPLDVHWNLQAVSVPLSGGLGLSLNATSGHDSRISFSRNPSQDLDSKKPFCGKEEQDDVVLTCCQECTSNYEREASIKSIQQKSFSLNSINKDTDQNGSSQLPFWLKPHGIDKLIKDDLVQLRRKYNKLCQSLHQNSSTSVISNQCYLGKNYTYTSSYPSWPNKNSMYADSETISFAHHPKPNQTASSLTPRFRRQQSCHIDFSFSNGSSKYQSVEPNLDSLKGIDDKEVMITLAIGNSTYANAVSANEKIALENNADLCNMFQENVPWQCEAIPLMIEALNDLKSMNGGNKFILIQGNDFVGKRRFAVGVAKSMFGSSELLLCMSLRKSNANKCEMLEKALRSHAKLVILVEDVDFADYEFAKFLSGLYDESGKLMETTRRHDEKQAIFILTIDGDASCNKSKKNMDSVIQMKLHVKNGSTFGSETPNLDCNKRKADRDMPVKSKNQRKNNEMEDASSHADDDDRKREFTRQLSKSSNALDLNIEADEDEVMKVDKPGIIIEQHSSSLRFPDKVKNRFVLNMNADQDKRAREMFMSKFKTSFEEVSGSGNIISSNFNVEEMVLEEVLQGSGLYLNSLFEQWLKEVFHKSLSKMVDNGDKGERVSISLCLGGRGESCTEDGFMGTCLPNNILVSLTG